MKYKASKDMTITIITISVIAIFLIFGFISIRGLIYSRGDITLILVHSGVLFLLAGTILGCYLFAPNGYNLDENELIINRPVSNKRIELNNIVELRLVDKKELRGMIRTFGVGGLFGNFGKYYCKDLGNVNLYCTQNKNYILVRTAKEKILITPDDLSIADSIKAKLNLK